MANANGALALWDALVPKLRQLIREETRSVVRKKKMNIAYIDKEAQTVDVYEASNPADVFTVPYTNGMGIEDLSAGDSVMVEWISDDFSTAVAAMPGRNYGTITGLLPDVTPSDNGKIVIVRGGRWVLSELGAVLSSINVTTLPEKMTYETGEALDLSGITVTATYSDGTTADVTASCSFSPRSGATLSTRGANTVSVSYSENGITENTSFSVAVGATLLRLTKTSDLSQDLYFTQSAANGVMIEWGDGSSAETVSDLNANASHTYSGPGDYYVIMTADDGVTWSPGTLISNVDYCLVGEFDYEKSVTYPMLTAFEPYKDCRFDVKYGLFSCTSLTRIKIPSDVTFIAEAVFSCCVGLRHVITTSVNDWLSISFYGVESNPIYYAHSLTVGDREITSLTIPNGITEVKQYAFYNCSSLTSVVLSSDVETIGVYAFFGCSGIASINIPGNVTNIGGDAFSHCSGLSSVTIPETITTLGSSVFSYCTGLVSATIGNGRTDTGSYTFYNCSSLVSVSLPSGLESIGIGFCNGCSSLATITIPSSVTLISSNAFRSCTSLTDITIPASVTVVSSSAFTDCTNLQTVRMDGSAVYGANCFGGCSSLASAYVPTLETWLGNTFNGSGATPFNGTSHGRLYINGTALAGSLTFPASVNEIKPFAFYHVDGITGVTIPSTVSLVDRYAFAGCRDIVNAEISSDVIGNSIISGSGTFADLVFSFCTSLRKIWLRNSVSTIYGNHENDGMCYGCDSSLVIYVERSSRPPSWYQWYNYQGTAIGSYFTTVYNQTTSPF